jgi:transcriptional regulator with XRE-family HTH domain
MITFELIGKRIKEIREEKGINQKEMSENLQNSGINISRETFSKIENGLRAINAIELNTICSILNVASEEIMKEEPDEDFATLFRTITGVSDEAIDELRYIQKHIKSIVAQKNLMLGKIRKKSLHIINGE